jgi:hypothetical protein
MGTGTHGAGLRFWRAHAGVRHRTSISRNGRMVHAHPLSLSHRLGTPQGTGPGSRSGNRRRVARLWRTRGASFGRVGPVCPLLRASICLRTPVRDWRPRRPHRQISLCRLAYSHRDFSFHLRQRNHRPDPGVDSIPPFLGLPHRRGPHRRRPGRPLLGRTAHGSGCRSRHAHHHHPAGLGSGCVRGPRARMPWTAFWISSDITFAVWVVAQEMWQQKPAHGLETKSRGPTAILQ